MSKEILVPFILFITALFVSACAYKEYSTTIKYSTGVNDVLEFSLEQKDTFPQLHPSMQQFVAKTDLLKDGCTKKWISKSVCDRSVENLFEVNTRFDQIATKINSNQVTSNEINKLASEATILAQTATKNISSELLLSIPISNEIEFYDWPEPAEDKPNKAIAGKCVWNGRKWTRMIVLYNGATKKDVTKKMEDYVMTLQPDYVLTSKKEDMWENYKYFIFNSHPEYYENTYYPYQ